eukprot:1496071-Prymnesium_polylepis.2
MAHAILIWRAHHPNMAGEPRLLLDRVPACGSPPNMVHVDDERRRVELARGRTRQVGGAQAATTTSSLPARLRFGINKHVLRLPVSAPHGA